MLMFEYLRISLSNLILQIINQYDIIYYNALFILIYFYRKEPERWLMQLLTPSQMKQ